MINHNLYEILEEALISYMQMYKQSDFPSGSPSFHPANKLLGENR